MHITHSGLDKKNNNGDSDDIGVSGNKVVVEDEN